MTRTSSPTRTLSELPGWAGFAPVGTRSSCSSERSAAGSDATTRAGTTSPPMNSTVTSSMAWTTCDAVMTFPSPEASTPEPVSRKVTRSPPVSAASRPFALMTTTDERT